MSIGPVLNIRTYIRLLLTLVCLCALSGLGLAQDGVGGGLSPVVVTSALRPSFQLSGGEIRTGAISIRNDAAGDALVEIRQVDFVLDPAGEVVYASEASWGRSNLSWVEVGSQARIPAGGSVEVPYTVRVPEGVGDGTYWSMILVEPADATTFSDEAEGDADVRTNVSVTFRYAIAVLVDVGRPVDRQLAFMDPVFGGEGGRYGLSVNVHNQGDYLTEADIWLELYDDQGVLVTRVERSEARIYPGATVALSFALGALDPRRYQAVVIADAGGEDVFGVRYTLAVSADDGNGD